MTIKYRVTIDTKSQYLILEETDINEVAFRVGNNVYVEMTDEGIIDVLREGADVRFMSKDEGCTDYVTVEIIES